jgi:hypothetical protein
VECRDGGFLILSKIVGDKALIQDPEVGRRPQLKRQRCSRKGR